MEEGIVAQIFEIDQLRASRKRGCYCDAARAGREYFAGELGELRRTMPRPEVLCLESLEGGIPAVRCGWDFVYSAGLFTALPAVAARQVVKTVVSRLKPGGRLLIANIRADVHVERCPRCQEMAQNHRTELEMVDLAGDVPLNTVTGQVIFPDRTGLNVCLELHKSMASFEQPQLMILRELNSQPA